MINVQQWVESKEEYNTLAKRARVEEIRLTEPNLEGELDLVEFAYESGVRVYIYPNVDANKLNFINQPDHSKIIKLINAQEWLDKNYPENRRSKIKKIDVSRYWFPDNERLTGSISLQNFINLEEIDCSENELIELELINCTNLTGVNCSNNKLINISIDNCLGLIKIRCNNNELTNFDFLTKLNPEKLTELWIDANDNFPTQDLSIFTKFTTLVNLNIGNNLFTGSLVPLNSLKKLRTLWLGNNNDELDSDIENLPASLETIYSTETTTRIAKKLTRYKNGTLYPYYNYQAWRKDHQYLVENSPTKLELEGWKNILDNLLKVENYSTTNSTIRKGLFSPNDGFQLWLREKISERKAQIREYYLKKIIDFYTNFSSEKELLKGLISTEFDFRKATEEQRKIIQKKRDVIYNQLKAKIPEEKIDIVLDCCKELVQLENKFGLTFELEGCLGKVDKNYSEVKIELPIQQ